jgi:hypothetical protein
MDEQRERESVQRLLAGEGFRQKAEAIRAFTR